MRKPIGATSEARLDARIGVPTVGGNLAIVTRLGALGDCLDKIAAERVIRSRRNAGVGAGIAGDKTI